MDRSELRILIVEDDLIIAENLKENLQEMGYGSVYHGANSSEGISLYQKHNPDIAIVDIRLNGSQLDGIDMIRSQSIGQSIPVIYLTSFADEAIRERAKKTHPSGYLIKPSTKTQIDIAIDMAISAFYRQSEIPQAPKCPLQKGNDCIFLKVKSKEYERYEKFYVKDISYIKAEGSYTQLWVRNKSPLISMSLNKALETLQAANIVRCHRSYAVNLDHVHSVDQYFLYVMNDSEIINIPIGDQYRGEVNKVLVKI